MTFNGFQRTFQQELEGEMIGQYEELLEKLEELFGSFDSASYRFSESSNTEIARQMGYSDAQFSRLIHASATKGEYERALQNVGRIIRIKQLEARLNKRHEDAVASPRLYVSYGISLLLLVVVAFMFLRGATSKDDVITKPAARDDMLNWSFEGSFVNPYIPLEALPEDCNFPCYKYQGQWTLDETYKLPFFQERTGFHYLATEVNMYARCLIESEIPGNTIEGYEYQKHEIWYDIRQWPVDSFLLPNNELKEVYRTLDFASSPHFVLLADVHTFFRDEIEIADNMLYRKGKVIGRDIEFVRDEQVEEKLQGSLTLDELHRSLDAIANNKMRDFSKPVSCLPAAVPHIDFNMLTQGDKISFACQLTTAGLPMGYQKTYVLKDQYIKNRCRSSLALR